MRFCYIILALLFLHGSLLSKKLKEGIYRGVLTLNAKEGIELPFNFEVKYSRKKPLIIIRNADERISVDEITIKGDSVNFKMPVFNTEFKTKLIGKNLEGVWINHYRAENNVIPFKAVYAEPGRFLFATQKPDPIFEGRWETTFSPGEKETTKAVGIFHHHEQTDFVTGTFLTETGDYRYLEGVKNGNMLYLSCFDGSHAFLFTAKYSENKLNGKFYSGAHWQEYWTAIPNNTFKLKDAGEITFVKNKEEKLNLLFADTEGKMVSLGDAQFANKPVIVQVMGSWCPNCMDESLYLQQLYKQYNPEGLEITGLAFEKTNDLKTAQAQVQRMQKRLGIEYTIMVTLKTGRANASETLPMLNAISAFPTTLFLNRRHEIVRVHTGFSGPATGTEYDNFKRDTEIFIRNLLKE